MKLNEQKIINGRKNLRRIIGKLIDGEELKDSEYRRLLDTGLKHEDITKKCVFVRRGE